MACTVGDSLIENGKRIARRALARTRNHCQRCVIDFDLFGFRNAAEMSGQGA
ncbi:hypothetical protein FQZ97_977790 [compost metagenome]